MEPEQKNISNNLATLALILAVGALVLAWLAYDRQAVSDAKENVKMEAQELGGELEDAAKKTGETTLEVTGSAVQKTGEAIEATGEATKEAGTDIKNDNESNQR